MPVYNFVCKVCGAKFEEFISFNEDPEHVSCPNGHRQVRQVFSPPTIIFKGKGFYVTDHPSSGK
jgi:putative FmdB family regulatory protein